MKRWERDKRVRNAKKHLGRTSMSEVQNVSKRFVFDYQNSASGKGKLRIKKKGFWNICRNFLSNFKKGLFMDHTKNEHETENGRIQNIRPP